MSLLLFSLGPVQDFIASARRCQDLWYGSWLLSKLSKRAAEAIEETFGTGTLVFPSALGNDESDARSVANKIIAFRANDDGTGAKTAAQAARDAVRNEVASLAQTAFGGIPDAHFHRDMALAQVRDLMETMWVVVPCASEGEYKRARQTAEHELASRKATRNWGPVPWTIPTPVPKKSSLDGQRESVFADQLYRDFEERPDALRKTYRVKMGERLCGIGLLKRIGEDETRDGHPRFHSTAHVATAGLRAWLSKHRPDALATYLGKLEGAGVDLDRFRVPGDATDGYVLYEDRLRDLATQYGSADEKVLRTALRALLGDHTPTAYYAILLADGDRMGAAIDALGVPAGHRNLSRRLEAWAAGCRETIEGQDGSLIYAGGDDVLALLPLCNVLDAAGAMRTSFGDAMALALPNEGARPTLSIGLAIVHHMEPISDALALARRAERLAKKKRNSLAILWDKRSGSPVEVTAEWPNGENDEALSLTKRIETWGEHFATGALPGKAAFVLDEVLGTLGVAPDETTIDADLVEPLKSLGKRALDRREGATKEQKAAASKGLDAAIGEDAGTILEKVRRLSAELQLARLFRGAWDEAEHGLDRRNHAEENA